MRYKIRLMRYKIIPFALQNYTQILEYVTKLYFTNLSDLTLRVQECVTFLDEKRVLCFFAEYPNKNYCRKDDRDTAYKLEKAWL